MSNETWYCIFSEPISFELMFVLLSYLYDHSSWTHIMASVLYEYVRCKVKCAVLLWIVNEMLIYLISSPSIVCRGFQVFLFLFSKSIIYYFRTEMIKVHWFKLKVNNQRLHNNNSFDSFGLTLSIQRSWYSFFIHKFRSMITKNKKKK